MAVLYIETPEDEFTADDWKELLDNVQPGGGDVFGLGRGEAVLVGYIPARKRRSARTFFLGFAEADNTNYTLKRTLPVRHPEYADMWCTAVIFQQFAPTGNTDNENNAPNRPALATEGELSKQGNYQHCYVTLRFSNLPYRVVSDEDLTDDYSGKEYNRFVTRPANTQASVQVLQAETSSYLKFAEGSGAGSPTQPTAGTTEFPGVLGVFQTKTSYSLIWHMVPEEYIFDGLIATKFNNCIGRVSSEDFLGFPAGTLLMEPPRFDKRQFPVVTQNGADPLFLYDVQINFQHFDPSKGVDSVYRGHNLMPWRNDGKYYLATRTGATSGEGWLPTADFAQIFDHVLKPEA